MINLSWDIYDGITNRAQCAEILARSFLVTTMLMFSKMIIYPNN